MRFAIAVKGTSISTNTDSCDGYIIFEEKHGKIILSQSIDKSAQGSDELPDFLSRQGVKAILCENMDESKMQSFFGKGIIAETRIFG